MGVWTHIFFVKYYFMITKKKQPLKKTSIANLLIFNFRVLYRQQAFINIFVSDQNNLLLLETACHSVTTVVLRQSSVTPL